MVTTSFKKRTFNNFKIGLFVIAILISVNAFSQSKYTDLKPFDKVIISPHIQVTFIEGNKASVTIDSNKVSDNKLNVEVNGKTLRIYLDGAKVVTKSERHEEYDWKSKRFIYQGTIVTATVTYTHIEELSLRGEETFVFQNPIAQEKLKLKVYGESKVYFNALELRALRSIIYGEASVSVKAGSIDKQHTTCFGECRINMPDIKNRDSKVIAYGEGKFDLNVSDDLKVTAFGEATVTYKGNPNVTKGIVLGKASIIKN